MENKLSAGRLDSQEEGWVIGSSKKCIGIIAYGYKFSIQNYAQSNLLKHKYLGIPSYLMAIGAPPCTRLAAGTLCLACG